MLHLRLALFDAVPQQQIARLLARVGCEKAHRRCWRRRCDGHACGHLPICSRLMSPLATRPACPLVSSLLDLPLLLPSYSTGMPCATERVHFSGGAVRQCRRQRSQRSRHNRGRWIEASIARLSWHTHRVATLQSRRPLRAKQFEGCCDKGNRLCCPLSFLGGLC